MVAGIHPREGYDYYLEMVRAAKRARPDIHVKAFTAVEVFFFHRLYRMSVEAVLSELKEAGLGSMPGGGAEIFAKETRNRIIKGKADAEQWLDVMRTAHRLGIPSNATMLYGHVESLEERVDHLVRLRELQDETGGFVTFIPLAFQPWEAPAMKLPETTGFEDLKAIVLDETGAVEYGSAALINSGGAAAEVARQDLPDGDLSANTSAHAYPDMAFVDADGLVVATKRMRPRARLVTRPGELSGSSW